MGDSSGKRFRYDGTMVLRALAVYLKTARAGKGPTVKMRPVAELTKELRLQEWIRDGGLKAKELEGFLRTYLDYTTRMHHPGYMAHQVSVPHPSAALADLIHGLTNNPMAVFEMGPSAVTVEVAVLDWMLEKVGWGRGPGAGRDGAGAKAAEEKGASRPGGSGSRVETGGETGGTGVLTHGGSLANLTALLAARARVAPKAWEEGTPGDLAILAPECAHYSIARSVSILGLGSRALIPVETDAREVVVPDRLPEALRRCRDAGRRVMAVVANACATSTGLYDPLEEMAAFCAENSLWLHVDGCHGAAALLSARERGRLKGIERADSVVWDAHKMLRTSTLCTAVLFRDGRAFDEAFHQEASYIFYKDTGEKPGPDLIRRTVECTKAGLGLKLFLVLAADGEDGIRRYYDDRVEAAKRFARIIRERPGFEVPFEPESNILCFRHGTDNARQIAIREALLREGRYHISSTEVKGVRYLRLSLMSPATNEKTMAGMLEAIEKVAARIDRGEPAWRGEKSGRRTGAKAGSAGPGKPPGGSRDPGRPNKETSTKTSLKGHDVPETKTTD